MKIGVLGSVTKNKTAETVKSLIADLKQLGYETVEFNTTNDIDDVDVVLVLGGDGAILHAAVVAAQKGIKIMQKQWIRLSTIQDIRIFIETVTMSDVLVDLRSQRYLVNGKSIMGIYSLDLQSPIEMIVHSDSCPELMEKLSRFFTDEIGE